MVTKRRTVQRSGMLTGPAGPSGPGRPPLYHEGIPVAAYRLCLLGITDEEMATVFGVSVSTINGWKREHPAFLQATLNGKIHADAQVAESLFKRALGYSHPAEKIFHHEGEITRARFTEHYPPDTAAAKHWLNNRRRGHWQERIEHAGDPTQPVMFQIIRAGGKG